MVLDYRKTTGRRGVETVPTSRQEAGSIEGGEDRGFERRFHQSSKSREPCYVGRADGGLM